MTLQVFISYKSEYREFARAVKSELNQWGFDTWLDVDNIQPGDYFRHKIQQGLDSSDVLLMVLTEEAQLSREVMSEVDYFLDVAKKPVVPLRHRECKPLYIFVSIQYIDFVTDQTNGFVQLKQRLSELAAGAQKAPAATEEVSISPQKSGAAAIADFLSEVDLDEKPREQASSDAFGGLANRPEPEREKSAQEEKEKKQAILDDGLFDLPLMEPASQVPPKPQPVPPPPQSMSQQGPIAYPAAPPASPIIQPQRQSEFVPQPASPGRKRSSPILWPLAAVASLIIVVGAVVLFSSNAMLINTTQAPQGTSPLVWVGVLVVAGVIGVFGWRWLARSKTSAVPYSSPTEDTNNRAIMLQKVEDFWLKGVLDPALEAGSLDIGLSSAPGAVLRHKDYGDYELPPNANILDVFNDLNRELLILGAPGGGKTVLLLQLAKALIEKAKSPHPSIPSAFASGRGEEPIPVVFNLSSWAAERKPLADWLVDELRLKYQVSGKVAHRWMEEEKLLLLLDGLDEVAEQFRNECVEAINSFRKRYRTVDLAICSRMIDYESLTSKLDVRGAIVLEPLSQPIIDAYLDRPELAYLRQIMANDTELREMSEVPFLLNAMAYAYAGVNESGLQIEAGSDTAKSRRRHLFDRWVEKRLEAHPNADFIPSSVKRWLGWLAARILTFKKIVFYIEEMQPDWLTHYQTLYRFGVVATVGVAVGLAFGVAAGLALGQAVGVAVGVIVGLTFGLIVGYRNITLAEVLTWRLTKGGLGLGLAFGIVFSVAGQVANGSAFGIAIGVIMGAAVVLVSGLQTGENFVSRNRPNQGITQSAFNALRVILAVGLVFGLAIGLVLGLAIKLSIGLTVGRVFLLAVGVSAGLACGLVFGGADALIKHLILRLILWQSGNIPRNYARFLDYCVNARLMRKVGGGYMFAHRYLMEYFAESYSADQK